MIRFIAVDDLLIIRNEVLRNGKLTPDECRFSTDLLPGAFHLGYYEDGELGSITSLHPQSFGEFAGNGYQLRGMATIAQYRGKGLGSKLVNFALVYLRGKKVNYVWCNARKKATEFYTNLGFEKISVEFDVPGIGPHYVMYVKLQ